MHPMSFYNDRPHHVKEGHNIKGLYTGDNRYPETLRKHKPCRKEELTS